MTMGNEEYSLGSALMISLTSLSLTVPASVMYCTSSTEHSHTQHQHVLCILNDSVTVTEALVLRPLLEDRGRITESVCILVPVDKMKQKCFQIKTKRVRRLQQFQLRRQPVPCSQCSNRKGSIANSLTCPRHDEVATP